MKTANSPVLYGIKNCDTMREARAWLDGRGIVYLFHDYKAAGVSKATVEAWADRLGWDRVLNRKGQTFRKLPDAQKADLTRDSAIELTVAQPSMIKRPVLAAADQLLVGFRPEEYAGLFRR